MSTADSAACKFEQWFNRVATIDEFAIRCLYGAFIYDAWPERTALKLSTIDLLDLAVPNLLIAVVFTTQRTLARFRLLIEDLHEARSREIVLVKLAGTFGNPSLVLEAHLTSFLDDDLGGGRVIDDHQDIVDRVAQGARPGCERDACYREPTRLIRLYWEVHLGCVLRCLNLLPL